MHATWDAPTTEREPFPAAARIEAPAELVRELLTAARRLPRFEPKDLYSPEVQALIFDRIRGASPAGFDSLVAGVGERVAKRPYCALVAGIDLDREKMVFVAVSRAFGELVAPPYRQPRAQLVHHLQPRTDRFSSSGGRESERLHTDTADWDQPVELISMLCVSADRDGGGRSRLLDHETLCRELRTRLHPSTLELLRTERVPWQLADYKGGGVTWAAVLSESGIRWRRYTIDLALATPGVTLRDEVIAALDEFERVVQSCPGTLDFLLREGELMFADNIRTIHARTPIADPATSGRLMVRSWIRRN